MPKIQINWSNIDQVITLCHMALLGAKGLKELLLVTDVSTTQNQVNSCYQLMMFQVWCVEADTPGFK